MCHCTQLTGLCPELLCTRRSDWEDDDFEPTLPGVQNNNHAAPPDSSKFADEDAEVEAVPDWQQKGLKAPEVSTCMCGCCLRCIGRCT